MTCCRVLLCVLAITNTAQGEDVSLRWKFTPGDSENYRMTQTAQLQLGVTANKTVEAGVRRVIDFRWSVASLEENGSAWVALDVTRVQFQATGPGGQVTAYDSQSEEPPRGYAATLVPLFTTLLESELRAHMSPRGEILQLEVPEDLKLMLSSKPVGKALGQLGSDKDLLALAKLSLPTLPAEQLAVGDQWEETQTLEQAPFGSSTASTIYQFQSIEDTAGEQLALIVPDTTIRFESSVASEPGVTIASQQCTGKILLNLTTGRPESSTLQERLEMTTTSDGDSASGTLVHTLSFETVSESEDN